MPGRDQRPRAVREYIALCQEARRAAGPGWLTYLDLAREVDEEHAASPGRWLAGQAIELANARSARRASTRAAETAATTAVLKRSEALELAVGQLLADPRLAGASGFSAGAGLAAAEVASELRIAMGMANRPPTEYEASMPAVDDLGRQIGVKR